MGSVQHMQWLGKLWAKVVGGDDRGGFLRRLSRDRAGNTLAIMAAALIPLAGMVGSGIDMSRMYITKTRLQHACDAGALAGRKSMGAGVWGTTPNSQAQLFFDANFVAGSYGSNTLTRSFSEDNGTVTGTASAVLPMTITRIIGQTTQTLSVSCSTTMQLPNTDVMFVLDVTGSMNCVATDIYCSNNGNVPAPGSKIVGLKNAVKCFYESVARQKTNGNCPTSPSGGLNGNIQVRFGFVPYASNVNVGYLLPTQYFANTWTYQSRSPQFNNSLQFSWQLQSTTPSTSIKVYPTPVPQAYCNDAVAATQNTVLPDVYSGETKTTTQLTYSGTSWNSKTSLCSATETKTVSVYVKQYVQIFDHWHYAPTNINVGALKSGTTWNTTMSVPIGALGTNKTVTWDGCIEEAKTVQATDYSPIPSGANDLNIDLKPTQGDTTTLWGMSLPDLIYKRAVVYSDGQGTQSASDYVGDYAKGPDDYCPTPAKKLQSWSSVTDFDSYVDSLVAQGNTYHDIGILWGARLMSPDGIFASENGLAANGGTINRNMIFMTDGDSTSSPCDYNAYGIPWWDRRQTNDVGPASQCQYNRQALIDQINYRYAALCEVVKNKGINLYVISYGNGSSSTTEQRLKDCASPDSYYKAVDPTALQNAFSAIAAKITMLRLTA